MILWCFWFRVLPRSWSQIPSDEDNRFTVYGIQDLGTQLAPVAMLVMMEAIQSRIIENGKKGRATWLYVDECHTGKPHRNLLMDICVIELIQVCIFSNCIIKRNNRSPTFNKSGSAGKETDKGKKYSS